MQLCLLMPERFGRGDQLHPEWLDCEAIPALPRTPSRTVAQRLWDAIRGGALDFSRTNSYTGRGGSFNAMPAPAKAGDSHACCEGFRRVFLASSSDWRPERPRSRSISIRLHSPSAPPQRRAEKRPKKALG